MCPPSSPLVLARGGRLARSRVASTAQLIRNLGRGLEDRGMMRPQPPNGQLNRGNRCPQTVAPTAPVDRLDESAAGAGRTERAVAILSPPKWWPRTTHRSSHQQSCHVARSPEGLQSEASLAPRSKGSHGSAERSVIKITYLRNRKEGLKHEPARLRRARLSPPDA